MSSQRTTMIQIAERAGVSLGTVSHVINGKAGVREKLRERVNAAIRELNYQPSPLARGLRTNSTNMVGMIVPDISNPFFPAVVRGAEDVLNQQGFHLVLCNTDNDSAKERSYYNDLKYFLPAGLILIPSSGADLREMNTRPMVCVDRRPANWKGDVVSVANEKGALIATQHLLAMHHRRIAMITGPLDTATALERHAGFIKALGGAGITLAPEFLQETSFTREGGTAAATRLLGLSKRPTAVFAANDLIALGVLSALKQQGLRCPEDMSLVGFDGLEVTDFTEPALTTVYQPGYELGATAARVLMSRIQNPQRRAQHVRLDVELRQRASVAPGDLRRARPKAI